MNSSIIDHKLRVFISSKCGGKYSIARKSLKTLLEVTGLLEVYVFETEPASSEDTISSYLEYVDESNLCVFLIDNADGVPAAVLSEEKRAKDKQLRLIYLFCDENKKDPTPMQEEIKVSLSQKYYVVNQFSDIVPKAYESVLQDLIAVYKHKKTFVSDEESAEGSNSKAVTDSEKYALSPSCYSQYPKACSVITRVFSSEDSVIEETSSMDNLLSEYLKSVIGLSTYNKAITEQICEEILKENSEDINAVLKLRFQAQEEYYNCNYDNCMAFLQNAISVSLEKQSVPDWISNDIAIDIRFVQRLIDENSNRITIDNPGQKLLDESKQPVFFPYLDRQVENMQESIAEEYYSQINISPYTIKSGGLSKIFKPLTNAFCIAVIHGSIVQTEITRDRLIDVYSMLCTLYNNHNFIVEYVRLLIINRNVKELDTLIRKYSQSIDNINEIDIDYIISSISYIPDSNHRMMSKYLLASRLGYYLSDEKYTVLYQELIGHSIEWSNDDKRLYCIESFIMDFYIENTHRASCKDVIDFLLGVYGKGLQRIYRQCFKVLCNIDYSRCEEVGQNRVLNLFVSVINNVDLRLLDNAFTSAIIRFCKNATVSTEELELTIKQKLSDFYDKTFLLEMAVPKKQDLNCFIDMYIEEARSANLSQGANGSYIGYAYESLDVIYNIISTEKLILHTDLLKRIISICLETLAAEKQTIKAKISAVKLLQYAYITTGSQNDVWDEVILQLFEKNELYSNGHEIGFLSRETNEILSFQYNLFICCFNNSKIDLTIGKLYSTDVEDSYTVLQLLKIINTYLSDSKGSSVSESILSAFLYYSIIMSQNRERDIKYYATRCLVELINYETVKRVALMHLSQMMDSGTQTEKIAILSRVRELKIEDDAYIVQILNKGKSDNNYLVRYVAVKNEF